MKNILRKRKQEILCKSLLTATELRQAEVDWIKINRITFENRKLNDLKREPNIIVDNENILRRKRRLRYAPLTYDSKTLILLNDKHDLSKLIIQKIRKRYKHTGLKQILTELR